MKTKFYLLITLAIIVLASFCIVNNGNNKQPKRKSNQTVVNTSINSDIQNTTSTNTQNTSAVANTAPRVNQIIYKSSNTHEGIIGLFNKDRFDNPAYNVFHISIDKNITENTEVWLEYELYGVQDFTSVCRSVNDQLSMGGLFVLKNEGWSTQSEPIDPKSLREGLNVVRFSVPENATYGYKVRNVSLRVKPTLINNERKLTVNQPSSFTYFKKYGYLQGFVSGKGSEKAKLTINGKAFSTNNGAYEGLVEKQDTSKEAWNATVVAEFEDGEKLKTLVSFNKQSDYDFANTFYTKIQRTEQQISPLEKINIQHQGIQLNGDTNSILTTANLSVTTLRVVDMPAMGTGMVNVTGTGKGFRLLPHQKFEKNLLIKIKYDTTLLPIGYRPEDIRSYYFDETANNWKVLKLDTIDKVNCMIVSRTNHFTDFINSIIKTPEMPETQAYTPTSLKDVKVANPLQGLNLISPPSANNMGTANLSFPIEIPAGRQGMQPNLALQYNSGGGNGWVGIGWDLSIPSITVETRWGVPRYDYYKETESYLLAGEQLNPQIHRQEYVNRTTDKRFYPRIEGAFNRIIRYGSNPKNYWWEVTDKNGIKSYYGKYPDSTNINATTVLADDAGNIAHWALTETVDLEGYSVRYIYDTVQNTGLTHGTVKGRQIYISSILYTNYRDPNNTNPSEIGKYQLTFERDYTDGRSDTIISCRYGFKEVTANLLKTINVLYNGNMIRRYFLGYHKGVFDKSLLCGIYEATADNHNFREGMISVCDSIITPNNISIGTKIHKFDYYDNISTTHYESNVNVTGIDDKTTGSTLFTPDKAYASGLSGTESKGSTIGGALGIGIGVPALKDNSVDLNYNYSVNYSKGDVTLADIDGDGLPDKIYKNSNGIINYRKLICNGLNSYYYDTNAVILSGVHNFLSEKSSTDAWGAELHLGFGGVSLDLSGEDGSSESMTSVYMADVNADGKIDIVDNGVVYFNTTGPSGQYFTSVTSDTVFVDTNSCHFIIHSGAINDSVFSDSIISKKLYHESVKMWVAPDEGRVNINAPIQLIKDTSYNRIQSKYVDGIRYTIQLENQQLIADTISANNYNIKYNFSSGIWVNKGDIIYFRLQSSNNREFDKVYWDPKITYYEEDTTMIDADGKTNFAFKSSEDFILNGKSYLPLPFEGSIRIRGMITAPALSDTLHLQIYKNATSLVKESNFVDNFPINYYIDTTFNIDSADILNFYLNANTNINWSSIKYDLKVSYITAPNHIVYTNAWDSLSYKPLIQYKLYQNTCAYSLPKYMPAGNYTVSPNLTFSSTPIINGTLILAIKKAHQILGKTILTVQNNVIIGNPYINFNLYQDTDVYFEYYVDSSDWSGLITQIKIILDSNSVIVNNAFSGLFASVNDTLWKFGPLYRGWGQFCYNPDSAGVYQPINQNDLTLSAAYRNSTFFSQATLTNITNNLDTAGTNKYSFLDSLFQTYQLPNPFNDKFSMMFPYLDSNVYRGLGNLTMVGSDKMSNAPIVPDTISKAEDYPIPLIPEIDINNPNIITYHNAKAPRKLSVSTSNSFNINMGSPFYGQGSSFTDSKTSLLMDYMDMNGDRYPDIIGTYSIQYSTPQGGLEPNARYVNFILGAGGGINYNTCSSTGNNYGASYPHNKTLTNSNPKAAKTTVTSSGSLSANYSESIDITSFTIGDINGDGLPDKLFNNGYVALNLGYKYAPIEKWNLSIVRKGASSCTALSGGISGSVSKKLEELNLDKFNIFQTSISVGFGSSNSKNDNSIQLMDINGDGLADIVTWGKSTSGDRLMQVYFNTGNDFVAINSNPWDSISTYTENSSTYGESANLAITFGFTIPIPLLPLKFILNPQGGINNSFTKEKVQLIDMNADGYPDYVISDMEGNLSVRYSNLGKLNLLKGVTNSTGSNFVMDYSLSDNSVISPQRSWQLASVNINDGHHGDGGDNSISTYAYKDPVYDRYERQSFGYDSVITSIYNSQAATPYIYRTMTEAYHTDKFMFKGLKKYEVLKDSANRKFVETIYTWKAALISTGQIIPDSLIGCFEGYYPVTTKEDRYFYEGASTYSIHTQKEYIYGTYGNVTQFIDHGDVVDTSDDVTANIDYSYTINTTLNLLSLPDYITVLHNGQTLRSRSTSYDPNTGKVTMIYLYNTNSYSLLNFTHDRYGNIISAVHPENSSHQRKTINYTYDTIVHIYPIAVYDESHYQSTADYNYYFGKPTLTTDISGNNMEFTYDSYGRVKTIKGPKEIAASKPYTIKFDYWDDHNRKTNDADSVLWARTRHYDPADTNNEIISVMFTDGLGRGLQTKKNASIYNSNDYKTPNEIMIVSGRVMMDAYGRTISATYPITETLGRDSIYNYSIDDIIPSYFTYDVLDRKTSVTLPDQTTSTMNYGFGNDTFGVLRFKTIATDANGIETAVFTNDRQLKTTIISDNANSSNDDSTITVTSLVYNPLGELLKSIDPEGNVTTHFYDLLGHKIQRVHPDAGTTKYTYDDAGNLIEMQTQNLINQSKKINYYYNYKHLDSIVYPQNPENNAYYEYGDYTAGNQSNRIIRQQDASGVQQFFYNNLGELTKNIHTFVMPEGKTYTFATEWEYDTWNRLLNIIYPDSEKVNYYYNKGGQLNAMTSSKSGTTYNYINYLCYDKFESRVYMQYGNSSEMQYTYDIYNRRLSNLTSNSGSGTMQDLTYTYDNIGNITQVQNSANITNNGLGGTYQYNYTYDNINRLIYSNGIWNDNNTPTTNYALEMSYSRSGNITLKEQEATAYINGNYVSKNFNNGSYTYGTSKPHAVSFIGGLSGFEGPLSYDDNGNMTYFNNYMTSTNRYHCWDEENRLSAVKDENYLSCYTYDAGGERVLKLTGQVEQMLVNNEYYVDYANLNYATLYTSPYMVVNDKGYSKHYYIEGQRICSKLGGGFQNSLIPIDTVVPPLQIDYKSISTGLATMLKRNIECVNFNSENIALPSDFKLPESDTIETGQYFYHTDHLGSSSWITDVNSTPIQHLQNLPYGDVFVDQRDVSNFYTPYKFTGKEQDEETQYSYFGARYYIPELLSVWLSVDQMTDKYPEISPYNYCHWNPVMLIDPDGEDEWEVNKENGEIKNVKKTDNDVIFVVGHDGKQTGTSISFDGKAITFKNEGTFNIKGETKPASFTDLFFNNKANSEKGFNFLADNTDVEWSKINADNLINPENQYNSIHTSHKKEKEYRGATLSLALNPEIYKVTSFSHSHPEHNDNDYTSMSDRNHKDKLVKIFPDCDLILRYSGQQRSYKKDNSLNDHDKYRDRKKAKIF